MTIRTDAPQSENKRNGLLVITRRSRIDSAVDQTLRLMLAWPLTPIMHQCRSESELLENFVPHR